MVAPTRARPPFRTARTDDCPAWPGVGDAVRSPMAVAERFFGNRSFIKSADGSCVGGHHTRRVSSRGLTWHGADGARDSRAPRLMPSVSGSSKHGEIHRVELQHDWDLLQSGRPPVKIEPLR
jgi:hypothetical protein